MLYLPYLNWHRICAYFVVNRTHTHSLTLTLTHTINKLSSKIPSFHAQLSKSTRMLFVNIQCSRSRTHSLTHSLTLHSTLMSIENLFYFLFCAFPFTSPSPSILPPLCYLLLDLHCAKIVFTYTASVCVGACVLCWCVCFVNLATSRQRDAGSVSHKSR